MPARSLIAAGLGLLDILLFLRHAIPAWEHAFRYFRDPAPWPPFVLAVEVVRLAAVASLLASGILLLRGRTRWLAVAVTVLQLPLRIAFELYTFDLLLFARPLLPPTLEAQYALLLALLVLDVARAVATAFILRTRSRARPAPPPPRGGGGS
jgi:hypothetical protein